MLYCFSPTASIVTNRRGSSQATANWYSVKPLLFKGRKALSSGERMIVLSLKSNSTEINVNHSTLSRPRKVTCQYRQHGAGKIVTGKTYWSEDLSMV